MDEIWRRVTDFGNSAVTLPLAAFAALYLACFLHRPRAALALVLATGGGAAFTLLVLKLALRACLDPAARGPVVSPSGHAAMSAAVYGSLALLLARGSPHRRIILAGTALFVVAIAVSRLALEAHTLPEVLIGLGIGAGFAMVFGLTMGREPGVGKAGSWPLLAISALIVVAAYGLHPPIEETIKSIAPLLQDRIPGCGGTPISLVSRETFPL